MQLNWKTKFNQFRDKNFKQLASMLFEKFLTADDKVAGFPKSYLDQYNQRLGIYPVSDFLPQRTYDPELGIYSTAYGMGFIFKGEPLVSVDSVEVINLHRLLQIELPIGTCGQIMLHASSNIGAELDEYEQERSNACPVFKKLASNRAKYLKLGATQNIIEQPFLVRNYDLYLSFHFDNSQELTAKEIYEIKQRVAGTLKTLQINAKTLSATGWLEIASQLLRPTNSAYSEGLSWDPTNSLNRQIVDPFYLRKITSKRIGTPVNDWETYSFSVRDYNRHKAPELWKMSNAIGGIFDNNRLACPFTYSLIFKICDSKYEVIGAETKSFNADTRARERKGKSFDANDESYLWREILSQKEAGERILITNFNINLYCRRNGSGQHIAMLNNIFSAKMGWRLQRNDLVHMPLQLAHIPLSQTAGLFSNLSKIGLTQKLWSMNVANIAPVLAEMKGMQSRKMVLVGRRGQILFWDPFANTRGNYNVAVVGGSGAGKSVWLQEAVTSQLATNGRVWVVDIGRSYLKLANMLGGNFVEFNQGTKLCINPFWTANRDSMDKETTDSFLQFVSAFIYAMAFAEEAMRANQSWCLAVINKVVYQVWTKFLNSRLPTIQDVIDELAANQDNRIKDLAVQLFKFGKHGCYGKYFNGDSGLDFTDSFIVFELEEITADQHLRSLIFMLLLHHITEKMYLSDRQQRMTLVIDEAWDLLKGGLGAIIIESIARRARKYQGSLWTGTQSMNDYGGSAAARAAWDNSYWQAMLSQDKASITSAVSNKLIHLHSFEEQLMKDVHTEHGEFSEIMLRGKAGEYLVGRFILDPFSKALYSTQPHEFAKFNQLRDAGFDAEQALVQLAREYYEYKD